MENNKQPQIRFKEFDGEWRLLRLGEVVDFYDEKRVPIESEKRVKGEYPYYGANGVIDYVEDFIFEGEYVLLAEDGANIVMRNSPLVYLTSGKFWVNNHAHIMKMKSGSNTFLSQLLENQNYEKYNSGTAQPKLNGQVVKNMFLNFPESDDEQYKIGSFFKQLDQTISLQQQELETLKQTKQGFLQKMFPKEGETVPEVRFDGFHERWNPKKLYEITVIVGGGTPDTNNPEFWDGEIDWYSPREIGKNIYADGSAKKITSLGLSKSSAKILPANRTILFTSRAGIGDAAILKKDGSTNQGFQSMVVHENHDVYFLYSMKYKIKEYALKNASGSTFLEVSGKILGAMTVLIPSFEEQIKIGEFFRKLDKTIELHERELEALKETKKAFLQKMFV